MTTLCPCHSGKPYSNCCEIYHNGKLPENALQLMRSRYSAYAKHDFDYIMHTTHPSGPHFKSDKQKWKSEILNSYSDTQFEDLKILEFIDGTSVAYVTFFAKLSHAGRDTSFTEKSYFVKEDKKWLYYGRVND